MKSARVGPELSRPKKEIITPTLVAPAEGKSAPTEFLGKKLARGWCIFKARRRCYVEGVLLEATGQHIALSAVAALRQKHNKHIMLVAGEFPETKKIALLDINEEPIKNRDGEEKTREVVADDELNDLDGDPKVGPIPFDEDDEQAQIRALLKRGPKG